MTQQVINIGSAPNDSTGDPAQTAFDKANDNFTELYAKGTAEGLWNFQATSSDTTTEPVSGRFKTNSGNYRDATQIAIHATTIQGIDRANTLRTLLVGDLIQCQDRSNAAAWCRYSLLSLPVDHTTWFAINVALKADGGVASGDNQEIIFVFSAGSGAPVGAEYITSTANATLTSERVLADTATVTWDRTTAGQIKANATGGGGTTTAPTRQVFTSGSGTYNRPASVIWIEVELVGGGGGGGTGVGVGNNGVAGGNTTFSTLTGSGGGAGLAGGNGVSAGGTASGGDVNLTGATGTYNGNIADGVVKASGGMGGGSFFGAGGGGNYGAAGTNAAANTGAGGGGGGTINASVNIGGTGGGAGGYVRKIIGAPAATYSYAVGPGGAGGVAIGSGAAGGAGGSGLIIVTEHY